MFLQKNDKIIWSINNMPIVSEVKMCLKKFQLLNAKFMELLPSE